MRWLWSKRTFRFSGMKQQKPKPPCEHQWTLTTEAAIFCPHCDGSGTRRPIAFCLRCGRWSRPPKEP